MAKPARPCIAALRRSDPRPLHTWQVRRQVGICRSIVWLRRQEMYFIITRVFERAATSGVEGGYRSGELDALAGAKGISAPLTCEVDLRPGGTFRDSMLSPDGGVMWGKWVYQENCCTGIAGHCRFCSMDENGNPIAASD